MTISTFVAEIKGLAAILQHSFQDGSEFETGTKTRTVQTKNLTPREEAERCSYRDDKKHLFMPGASISRMLREAGASHKQKGSRKSVKYLVPAAVIVTDETLTLCDPNTKKPLKNFEVDSRPIVIPATKGRIMRHRPRLDEWMLVCNMQIDETVLDPELIHQLLEEGGRRIGIGDYRPERGGSFGRFEITSWKRV